MKISILDDNRDFNGSIVGHNAEGSEECVHRAAKTHIEAVLTGKGLAHHTVKDEVTSKGADILVTGVYDF